MGTRGVGRLTAQKIKNEKEPGMYSDGGGLYLRVTPEGTKNWVYRFMLSGKANCMGLGPVALYGLHEARQKALDARRLRHEGIDPIKARRAQRARQQLEAAKAMTFAQCADAYIKAHRAGWRNEKHAGQWGATLATYAEPIIGPLPVQAIDTALVMKVLEREVRDACAEPAAPLWTARPETASRLRGRIESILDWAKVRGYRDGENPARWRGHLDKLLPARAKVRKVEHHAALPYGELPGFLATLRMQEGTAAHALEFTILTAARTGEVIGARRNEFNLSEKLWTVPGNRMKAGRESRSSVRPGARNPC
jgi:integrase